MALNWPQISSDGGDLPDEDKTEITQLLNRFADLVERGLSSLGFQLHTSPLWRPWSLVTVKDSEKVLCAFSSLSGGIANTHWLDHSSEIFPPNDLVLAVRNQLGRDVTALVVLPKPGAVNESELLDAAAVRHVTEVERSQRLGRLGDDLVNVQHLEPYLREFLNDHPDPRKNVFVMMRFLESEQLHQAHAAIKQTLSSRGFHAVRADDRDYTGELWSNVEVCMACCHFGIAIFEDIEQRDFNPNVSLELGYMLGRRRRCLILKEQRLPNLPADVIHRLYKPFDMFNVSSSVSREVGRWVDIDLGLQDLDR